MNSQKTKMPGDAAALKKEYMRYLELQAQNDQKNLNASLLYRIQGQPSVQMPDNLTLTERLADQVKLRVTLRQELLKITDDSNAGQIVSRLDANELKYVAQNMPRLVKFFELEYAVGVPAEIFFAKIRQDMLAQEELQAQEQLGVDLQDGEVMYDQAWANEKLDLGQVGLLVDVLRSLIGNGGERHSLREDLADTGKLLDRIASIVDLLEPIIGDFSERQGDTSELISPRIVLAIQQLAPTSQVACWKHIGKLLGPFPSKAEATGWITHLQSGRASTDAVVTILQQINDAFESFGETGSLQSEIRQLMAEEGVGDDGGGGGGGGGGGSSAPELGGAYRFTRPAVVGVETPVQSPGELEFQEQPPLGGAYVYRRPVADVIPFVDMSLSPIPMNPRDTLQQAALMMQTHDQMDASFLTQRQPLSQEEKDQSRYDIIDFTTNAPRKPLRPVVDLSMSAELETRHEMLSHGFEEAFYEESAVRQNAMIRAVIDEVVSLERKGDDMSALELVQVIEKFKNHTTQNKPMPSDLDPVSENKYGVLGEERWKELAEIWQNLFIAKAERNPSIELASIKVTNTDLISVGLTPTQIALFKGDTDEFIPMQYKLTRSIREARRVERVKKSRPAVVTPPAASNYGTLSEEEWNRVADAYIALTERRVALHGPGNGHSVDNLTEIMEEQPDDGPTKKKINAFRGSPGYYPFLKKLTLRDAELERQEEREVQRQEESQKKHEGESQSKIQDRVSKVRELQAGTAQYMGPKFGSNQYDIEYSKLKLSPEKWTEVAEAYLLAFQTMQRKSDREVDWTEVSNTEIAAAMSKEYVGRDKNQILDFFQTFGGQQFVTHVKMVSKGQGLYAGRVSRGRGLVKDTFSHLTSQEIDKPPIYFPLGRYYINKKRLMDDVLYLRGAKGNAISGFPSQKISPELRDCLLAMLKNRQPSLKGLTQEDCFLLEKVSKKCQLMDAFKFSQPTPPPAPPRDGEMDEDAQRIHRWDVLRGEMAAGNNSRPLVAEFKTMLLAFCKEERISQQECNGILAELATLKM